MCTSIRHADVKLNDSLKRDGAHVYQCSTSPVGAAVARLVIVHGYGEHCGRYSEFMTWMAGHGVACFSFDFRGHGRSSGRRGHVRRWEEYVDDLRTFLAQLRPHDGPPLFLLGHSHGGLVVLAAAIEASSDLASIAGVVLTSPYLRNAVPVPLHRRVMARIIDPFVPWARFRSGVRPEWLSSDPRMQQETIDDPLCHRSATPRWFLTMRRAQQRVVRGAHEFRLPMLMMIGSRDPVADPAACHAFYERAGSTDKSLKVYPEMVHELLREPERQRVFADIFTWMTRATSRP
jgi:alpha-beta hydrolase superfamily lysophospholipase